jgi:hypothetical protein
MKTGAYTNSQITAILRQGAALVLRAATRDGTPECVIIKCDNGIVSVPIAVT